MSGWRRRGCDPHDALPQPDAARAGLSVLGGTGDDVPGDRGRAGRLAEDRGAASGLGTWQARRLLDRPGDRYCDAPAPQADKADLDASSKMLGDPGNIDPGKLNVAFG